MSLRTILALGALWISLAAAPAHAAGGLSIFPDLIEDWMYGTYGGEILAAPWRSAWLQLVVLFVAIVFPLNAWIFKPLLRTLEQRGEKIEGARNQASALSKQADEVRGRYEAAVASARRDAESVRRTALDGARQDQARISAAARTAAEREVAAARVSVAGALDSARVSLRGETERLARDAAAQVLGRPVP